MMDEDRRFWTVAEQLNRYSKMDRFFDSVLLFRCTDQECNVFKWKAGQVYGEWQCEKDSSRTQQYLTGSRCEGMPEDVCGDIDIMGSNPTWPLVVFYSIPQLKQYVSEHHAPNYYVAEPSFEYPAFTKLEYRYVEIDSSCFVRGLECFRQGKHGGLEIHGPALSGLVKMDIPEYGEADYIPCFRCPEWPPNAQDFFRRPRAANWPSVDLLEQLRGKGCHVVAKGPSCSDRKDKFWRFSFSVAETTLIHEMDTSIYACYYFLKFMKNNRFPADLLARAEVSSYFFKTACLWFAETAAASSGISIMSKIRQILDWLISCYQKHELPHYFVPQQNLIEAIPAKSCREFAAYLLMEKAIIWPCVLSIPQSDEVRHAVDEMSERLKVDRDIDPSILVETLKIHSEAVIALKKATSMIDQSSTYYKERKLLCWQSAFVNIQFSDMEFFLKRPELITAQPQELLQYIMEKLPFYFTAEKKDFFKTVLLRCMARVYYELACHFWRNQDDNLPKLCNAKAIEFSKQGISLIYPNGQTDKDLSGHIQLAKLYYLNGQWDEVESTLESVFKIMDNEVMIHNAPPSSIHPKHDMCLIWKPDTLLFQLLIAECKEAVIQIPAVVLAYYIHGRLALVRGKPETAAADIQALLSRIPKMKHPKESEHSQIIVKCLQKYMEAE